MKTARHPAMLILVLLAIVAVPVHGKSQPENASGPEASKRERLVTPRSPVLGEEDAPVTLVEFFDPACEACRAFYPVTKRILRDFQGEVRLVLRYVPFHDQSEEVIRLLETARFQGVFKPVLDAIIAAQPEWADHGSPDISVAWDAAARAGLNVKDARDHLQLPGITALISRDIADLRALGIRATPTFFLQGKNLGRISGEQLYREVQAAVKAAEG